MMASVAITKLKKRTLIGVVNFQQHYWVRNIKWVNLMRNVNFNRGRNLTHRSIHPSNFCGSAKLTMNCQFSSISVLHPSSSSSSFVAAQRHPICFADVQGCHRSEQHQAHANKTTGEETGHWEREQKEGRKESSVWRPRFVPLRL
jgi:hypothetical protein